MVANLKLVGESVQQDIPGTQDPILEIFEYWRVILEMPGSKLGNVRKRAIRAAIATGYTLDELKLACVGAKYDAWAQGENKTGLMYCGIEYICRDETTTERFIALGRKYMEKAHKHETAAAEKASETRTPMPDYVRQKLDALFSKHKPKGA